MRITTIILLVFGMHVSAKTYSQTMTLSGKRMSLHTVFAEIKKQTGYVVFGNVELIRDAGKVSLSVKDMPLRAFLELAFRDKPVTYKMEDRSILLQRSVLPVATEAAPVSEVAIIPVTGSVTDSLSRPLAGASVTIKGKYLTVATGNEGQFTIEADAGDTLVISYVGYYGREVRVTGNNMPVHVTLRPHVAELADVTVVSTGYQLIPKERATGSFVVLDNKIINQQVTPNIIDRLDGIASGVLFNRGASGASGSVLPLNTLSIRGLSTMGEGNMMAPLVVLDNFPFEGDLNTINPNDVENIVILKDAAAASIWGTKAGNGVIVITTKTGRYNQKPRISFNSSYNITSPPDLYYIPQMPTSEFIDLETEYFHKGYYDAKLNTTAINGSFINVSPVVKLLDRQRKGELTEAEAREQIDAFRHLDIRDQMKQYLYRTRVDRQYALNIQGGGANFNYNLSGGYDRNTAELQGNERERLSIRSNTSIRPVKGLEIQTGLSFVQDKSQSSGIFANAVLGTTSSRWPYVQLADEEGNSLAQATSYLDSYIDTVGGDGRLLDWKYRGLDELRMGNVTETGHDFLLNLGVTYTILPGLKASVRYQFERYLSEYRDLRNAESYWVRDQINSFTPPGQSYTTSAVPYGAVLDRRNGTLNANQVRAQLDYDRSWKEFHLAAIAGTERRERASGSNSSRTYGYDNDLLTFKNVDYVNPYRRFNGANGYLQNYVSLSEQTYRFVSFYGNAAVTYRQRYVLSGSMRRDASNLFGVNINNKWQPLWSAGLAWNIAREPFYNISWLPQLKLRTTYGYQGNVNNQQAAVVTLNYITAADQRSNLRQAIVSNVPNPDLRWENVGTTNIGLDFGLANRRLSGSIEYYIKDCRDLLVQDPIDITLGAGSSFVLRNAGILRTKGLDLTLNAVTLRKNEFQWNTMLNASWNTNKVVRFNYVSTYLSTYLNNGNYLNPIPGKQAYQLGSFRFAGLDPTTGEAIGHFENKESKDYRSIVNLSTIDDLVFSGSARATMFGNLMNTFTWKGITLSANITYTAGHYYRSRGLDYMMDGVNVRSNLTGYYVYQQRWQKPGDELHTNVPRVPYPVNSFESTFISQMESLVKKADVVKLQFVNLAYAFTRSRFPALLVENVEAYCNFRNLGMIWKAADDIVDPDTGGAPLPMSVALGLKFNF